MLRSNMCSETYIYRKYPFYATVTVYCEHIRSESCRVYKHAARHIPHDGVRQPPRCNMVIII
jgi:hypothetical protein